MADLIAQGADPQQRWRRSLPERQVIVLGRAGPWAVAWDEHISRRHVELVYREGVLNVRRLPEGTNPIFFRGAAKDSFKLEAGEQFVIGQTRFLLAAERVRLSDKMPWPAHEQTFSADYLQQLRFRDAAGRIEVLSRVPELIHGAASDSELSMRLVNVLLAGMPCADAAALVAVDPNDLNESVPRPAVEVLHWDRRRVTGDDFRPSERLIVQSVRDGESILHSWGDAGGEHEFTMADESDWAFCTPISGAGSRGWAIYVAGRGGALESRPEIAPADAKTADVRQFMPDLRDELKFVELVASILSALREVRQLQLRQAGLRQFFSPVVLEALVDQEPDQVLAPRQVDVAVLFCDLRGFSKKTEEASEDLLGLLQRVSKALGVTTRHILDQGGVVGDFQGDAVMGFWGWPLADPALVQKACSAALGIQAEFAAAAHRPEHPLADFQVGIGIATGPAVAGKIGTADQVKVTVFGPVVNLASRLEGLTKRMHSPILLDERTAEEIRRALPPEAARLRRLAVVRPVGMDHSVEVSELLPPSGGDAGLTDEEIAEYEAALEAFRRGDWDDASLRLQRLPAADRAKDFLTGFIARHHRRPPPDWDGVITLNSK